MTGIQQWAAPSLEQAIEIAQGLLPREFETWDEVPGDTLTDAVTLLPTPTASDSHGSGEWGEGGLNLPTLVRSIGADTSPQSYDGSTSSETPPSPPTIEAA